MSPTLQTHDQLRERLDGYADARCRPEFGNVVYYVGGTQFAALTDTTLLMHLPAVELTEALKRGYAKPFVSVGAMGRNGWVVIPYQAAPSDELLALVDAAHRAAQHAHRRTRRRQPRRARRRSSGTA